MFARSNSRSVSMALVVIMAVIAIAIPTCTMIGCNMDMSTGMPFMPSGTGIYNACTGQWATNTGPSGVIPSGAESLLLTMVAAVVLAAVVLAPRDIVGVVAVADPVPPPPPEDPLGQRTRI